LHRRFADHVVPAAFAAGWRHRHNLRLRAGSFGGTSLAAQSPKTRALHEQKPPTRVLTAAHKHDTRLASPLP
jgi:hypothetical protein